MVRTRRNDYKLVGKDEVQRARPATGAQGYLSRLEGRRNIRMAELDPDEFNGSYCIYRQKL